MGNKKQINEKTEEGGRDGEREGAREGGRKRESEKDINRENFAVWSQFGPGHNSVTIFITFDPSMLTVILKS